MELNFTSKIGSAITNAVKSNVAVSCGTAIGTVLIIAGGKMIYDKYSNKNRKKGNIKEDVEDVVEDVKDKAEEVKENIYRKD
jgi:hypothetical protein